MLLTGTFPRTLDDKQRLAVPKPLRESLGYPKNAIFFIAPGTDGSLAFFPESVFVRLAEQMDMTSPNRHDVRAFSRLFYAQAQRVEIDRQGRMRIPAELAQLAGLDREIVLIGVRDHVEIWNRSNWEQYLSQQQSRYDEIAETAMAQDGSRTPEDESVVDNRPLLPR